MAEGTGGVPGLPNTNNLNNANISTDVSPKNIFDLIKQSNSQTMTSILPNVQAQFANTSKNIAPTLSAMDKSGEQAAASAISDAGARNMRGSDIEAAGAAGARDTAQAKKAEFLGQIAQQQATTMAQYIMEAHGYDIKANSDMYNNLAQALGQELSQQREMAMREEELKAAKKAAKENSKNSLLNSLMGLGVSALTGGGAGGGLLSYILGQTGKKTE